MLLTVARQIFTPISTCGRMYVDGAEFCFTLEPPRGPKLHPAGIYDAFLYESPEWSAKRGYPFRLPLLKNVPGFTGIEIHIGNKPPDTKGCTVVGMTQSPDAVGQSELAFFKLFHQLPQEFQVNYTE